MKDEREIMSYYDMSIEKLKNYKLIYEKKIENLKRNKVNLNIARGKPSIEQIELSLPMLDIVNSKKNFINIDGIDCRNYGANTGIYEAKKLMGELLEEDDVNKVIIFGNSSLNIMFDIISNAFNKGILGNTPWNKLEKVKFLCPVPGYDRHFKITEYFNIEMISIPMNDDGPDMDLIEQYVSNDELVKGIWCVQKYSNPSGVTFSDETVKRFSKLNPLAKDFRIFWDNAYCVHDLIREKNDELLDIMKECKKNNTEDLVYKFVSTSKITIPGAGISAISASKNNISEINKLISCQTLGYDKINQLRHIMFFHNKNEIKKHMLKQAKIITPKFDIVLSVLEKELKNLGIGKWTNPNGGYFILFKSIEGCAKNIIELSRECGLILTEYGSTYPYRNDPKDSDIRIAPTFLSEDDLYKAMNILVNCVKLVSINKILYQKEKC